MVIGRTVGAWTAGAACVLACSRAPRPQDEPAPADTTETAQSRLSREASRRDPQLALPVEKVWRMLGAAGFGLREQAQHPAKPWGAVYCVGAKTPEGIHLSVCEHASEVEAAAAVAQMNVAQLAEQHCAQRGATSLRLRRPRNQPELDVTSRAILAAFATQD